jgi:hypothetical protein
MKRRSLKSILDIENLAVAGVIFEFDAAQSSRCHGRRRNLNGALIDLGRLVVAEIPVIGLLAGNDRERRCLGQAGRVLGGDRNR